MKRLLLVALILGLFSLFIACANAAENNWRVNIKTDNGEGMFFGPEMHVGVHFSAEDGLDSMDTEAAYSQYPSATIWGTSLIPGNEKTWTRDIRSANSLYPNVWDLRFAGMPDSTSNLLRLTFSTLNGNNLPPLASGDEDLVYKLILMDNRGVADAPENGSEWLINMAETSDTQFFTLTLPMVKVSAMNHSSMLNEGYAFEFSQEIIPEPSALVALAAGFSGLAGIGLRRRRR